MHSGRIEQVGAPVEVYDAPANDFVMGFLGPVSRVGERLVRPHDLTLSPTPQDGAIEACVRRVVHLGFEVRIELELDDGAAASVQLTRAQTDELELAPGDVVWVADQSPEPVSA
jgi:sulfate transport system ATP-binding protein